MAKQKQILLEDWVFNLIAHIFIIIFIILIFAVGFRLVAISSEAYKDSTYNDICKFENGERWKFDKNEYFGQTCVQLNYISLEVENRIPFNYTLQEIQSKYCPMTSFWDFSKWNSNCELLVGEK